MNDIDAKIREALRQEDMQLLEEFRGERPLREMIIETFRSRHRWINIMTFAMPVVFLVLLVVFAYQFFHTESVRAMIAWAAGCLWSVLAIGMFKIVYTLELNKNSVSREIKRLELELAQLGRQILDK